MVPGTVGGLPAKHGLLGGTGGYLSHGLLFLFLRYDTLDWAKVGKEGLCVFVGVLRDFGILTKTLSHYSKSA